MAGFAKSFHPTTDLEALLAVVAKIGAAREASTPCKMVCSAATSLAGAARAAILLSQSGGPANTLYADHLKDDFDERESALESAGEALVLGNSADMAALSSVLVRLQTDHFQPSIIVPIVSARGPIGLLALRYRELPPSDRLDLLRILASLAGIALDLDRYESTIEWASDLNALLSASVAVAAHVKREELCEAILKEAVSLLGARSGGVYVLDSERQVLTLEADFGSPRLLRGTVLKLGEGLAGKLIESGEDFRIVDDYTTWEHRSPVFAGDDFFRCVLEVPLPQGNGDNPLGVLYVERVEPKFEKRDVQRLQLFARAAAVALVNSKELEATQLTEHNLRIVLQAITLISGAATPAEGLQLLCDLLLDVSQAEYCQVLIREERDVSLLAMAAAVRHGECPKEHREIPLHFWAPLEECIKTGACVLMPASDFRYTSTVDEIGTALFDNGKLASLLLVPLKAAGNVMGLAVLADLGSEEGRFQSKVIENIKQVAMHTAVQIDRVRSHILEERQRYLLQRLDDAASELRIEREPATLRKEIVNQGIYLADWKFAALYINRRALQTLELDCTAGEFDTPPPAQVQHGEGPVGQVVRTRRPKLIPRHKELASSQSYGDLGGQYTLLALPLKSRDGKVTHVLVIGHDGLRRNGVGDAFLLTDAEIMKRFSHRAATALQEAEESGSKNRTLRFLHFFRRFEEFVQSAEDLDPILYALLTGVTAGYGLGFNRAVLLMLNEQGTRLEGRFAIGQLGRTEAEQEWAKDRREQIDAETFFDSLESDGIGKTTPLNERIREFTFDFTKGEGGIFRESVRGLRCDVLTKDRLRELPDEFRAMFAPECPVALMPVIARQQALGILVVDNKFTAAPITDDLLDNLQTFAGAAALAIEKHRLTEKAKQVHRQMSALFQASNELVLPTLDDVVETTLKACQADSVSVILINKGRATDLRSCGTDKGMNIHNVVRPEGISIAVMRSGVAERIEETRGREQELNPWIYKDNTRSALCLPFRVQGKPIGVIWIHYAKPRILADPEVEALQLYVNQAAIAYDRARKVSELQEFQEAVDRINATTEYSEVADAIVKSIQKLLKASTVTIWPYDEASNKFISNRVHASGLPVDALQEPREGHTTYSVVENGYLAVDELDLTGSSTQSTKFFLDYKIASFQAIALTAGTEKVGVVYANYHTPRYFNENDEHLLTRLARYAGLALKKSLLKGQVTRVEAAGSAFADAMKIKEFGRNLKTIAQGIKDATTCDAVCLYTYDPSTKTVGHPPTMLGVNEPDKARKYSTPEDSIIYEIIRSEEAVTLERVNEKQKFAGRRFAIEEGIQSLVAVPLRAGGLTVGAVFVNYRTEHRFTEADLKAIDLLANQAAAAIRNSQLEGVNQQRLLDSACAAARKVLEVDFCNTVLPNEKGKLFFAAVDGWPTKLMGYELPDESHAAMVFANRRPVYVSSFADERSFKVPPVAAEFSIISGIGVPIFRGEDVIGAMLVHSTSPRQFTSDEIEYLKTLANQIAIGISDYGEFAGKRTRDRLRAVSAISEALLASTATDLRSLASDLLMQATQHVTDARGQKAVLATVQEYDAISQNLIFAAVYPTQLYPELLARLGERREIGGRRTASGLASPDAARCLANRYW